MNSVLAPFNLLGRFVASFHPRALPPMLRATYGRELLSWCFLPIMLGAIEGGTMSIIVKKAFGAAPGIDPRELNFMVALVMAAPNIGNITSFIWAKLSHGRAKVPFISTLQMATAVLVALIAVVPENRFGLYLLVLLVTGARITWTGVITIRTAVWGANYPRADRAGIAGKMATVQSLALAIVGFVIGHAMDYSERSFHVLFPLAALGGIAGNMIYRKVRLRGQRRLARAELAGSAADRPSLNPLAIWRVLRGDPMYRRFMGCLFVFGLGNLMLNAPLAIILNDDFHVSYWGGIAITTAIPLALMPMCIPLWSRLLKNRHVVEFRSIHAWSYVFAALLQFLAALFHQMWLLYAAAVVNGIANAGGVLAWNLGHHDFAPPHRDSQYMGVHVTLNGIRGIAAPFLAVAIYELLDNHGGGGAWVFAVCLVINTIGAAGFVWLNHLMRRSFKAGTDAPSIHRLTVH